MKNIKRLIPIIAIIIMGIILTVAVKKSGETLSVNTILRYTPQSTVLAAIIILSFFAFKKFDGCISAFDSVSCKWDFISTVGGGSDQYCRTCNYNYYSVLDRQIFRGTDCTENMPEISESGTDCNVSGDKYFFRLFYNKNRRIFTM